MFKVDVCLTTGGTNQSSEKHQQSTENLKISKVMENNENGENLRSEGGATTLLRGVIFAMDSSLLPTKVESNAKYVVGLINLGNAPIADVGIVISDILQLIKCSNIRVSFAPKIFPPSKDQFYLKSYPPCVENLVLADLPN
ncbi:hypothetical protein Q3G72_022240 [Acer saccharum]|nr:hypothetical protein Q3G72_022240 [Acer saccharum]